MSTSKKADKKVPHLNVPLDGKLLAAVRKFASTRGVFLKKVVEDALRAHVEGVAK